MELILRPYKLLLKDTFTISRQSFSHKKTLIVELKEGDVSGYGEASENPYYHKSQEQIIDDLNAVKSRIKAFSGLKPEDFWHKMYPYLKSNMFALCALDIAYHDFYTKKRNLKLYEFWGFDIDKNPITNYTIGIDTIDNMVTKLKAKNWPLYKIKLGTENDIDIIKTLRQYTKATFRIDANCAWTADETIKNAEILKSLNVEFIEQPLPAEDLLGAKEVYQHSVLPIIADESCQIEQDVEACYNSFHGINIKLVKCGGLTPARRMIAKAKTLSLKTMVGCMTESSVGISAIAHLLPQLDYVDMDGSLLLKNDIATGVNIVDGTIEYSNIPGIGVTLNP